MNTQKLFHSLLIIMIPVIFHNCEEKITEQERVTSLLTSGEWELQTAMVDGANQLATYGNIRITFTASTYNTIGGGVLWASMGTWTFTDDTAKQIERDDGLIITLSEISNSKLVMNFLWSKRTLGPGRSESVSGSHVFTFVKKI